MLTTRKKKRLLRKTKKGFLKKVLKHATDHRREHLKLHRMEEILFLTLVAHLEGCEGWPEVVDFGNDRLEFLRRFYPFKKGIPSKDTLRRFFEIFDPEIFKNAFVNWIRSLNLLPKEVVALDGKYLKKSSPNAKKKDPLVMVSAFACGQGMVLGQEKVADKSNEITAIPKLLEALSLKGCIVTLDAMGCQTAIASKILSKEADYLLALKGNHGNLHKDVLPFFEQIRSGQAPHLLTDYCETLDKGHGRKETRRCWVSDKIEWVPDGENWEGLKTLVMMESIREVNGKTTSEIRYYISSLPPKAALILHSLRSHWGIENQLHWVLDVVYKEDDCMTRKGNGAQNLAIIRHVAMNLIRLHKPEGVSFRRFQKKLQRNENLLKDVLLGAELALT